MRHGECRASTTRHGEHIYSGGELRRSNPSKLTWQKPTGEESSTRHGEHTYSRGELSQRKKYKRPFKQIRWGERYHTIILEATLGQKQRKDQRDSKEQGAQGLKEDTRSLRHHGLVPFHLFFSPCMVTMTMSN